METSSGLQPSGVVVFPASTKIGMSILDRLSRENQQQPKTDLHGLIPSDLSDEKLARLKQLKHVKLHPLHSEDLASIKQLMLKIMPSYLVLVCCSSSEETNNTAILKEMIDAGDQVF